MTSLLFEHLTRLIPAAIVLWVAAGSGRWVLARFPVRFISRTERFVFSTAAGFGLLSTTVFLLGACRCLHPEAVGLSLLFWAVAAAAGWAMFKKDPKGQTPLFGFHNPMERCAGVLLACCIGACFLAVLTPPIGNDALSYHLAVPKLYLKHHGFYFIPGNIFSNYPLNAEMLYTIGLAVGNGTTAKCIAFLFPLLMVPAMGLYAGRQMDLPESSLLGVLIFMSIPSVFVSAHLAYSDLAFTFTILLAAHAFLSWVFRKQTGWLVISGVLSGLAMGTKYAGLLLPFLGTLGVLWACRRHGTGNRQAFQYLFLYLICSAVAGSPFYIKNLVLTGNPFYPFFYKIFGGLGWDAVQARRYDLFHRSLGMGRGIRDYVMLPFNVSFRAETNSPRFDGILGPVFFLTLPFVLLLRNKSTGTKVSLAYCGFTFLFWAMTIQQIRYLMPVFPFLAATAAGLPHAYRTQRRRCALVTACIVAGLAFHFYHDYRDIQKINPLPYIAGSETKDAFYRRLVPVYPVIETINTHLPPDAVVFFIYMKNPGFLCERAYYSDSILESHTLERVLSGSETPETVRREMDHMGFTHLLYDIRYVLGEASPLSRRAKSLFTAFQKRFLQPLAVEKNRYYLFEIKKKGGAKAASPLLRPFGSK